MDSQSDQRTPWVAEEVTEGLAGYTPPGMTASWTCYHITRAATRAISLENRIKKVPYEGRTRQVIEWENVYGFSRKA